MYEDMENFEFMYEFIKKRYVLGGNKKGLQADLYVNSCDFIYEFKHENKFYELRLGISTWKHHDMWILKIRIHV